METRNNKHSKLKNKKKITRKQAIQKVGISALVSSSIIFLIPLAEAKTSSVAKPRKPGRR